MTTEQRAKLIFDLLQEQRRALGDKTCDCEHATLLCLKHGVIKGSEICPHCHGWLGRVTDENDTYSDDTTDSDLAIE
jgi:hypothetical protein